MSNSETNYKYLPGLTQTSDNSSDSLTSFHFNFSIEHFYRILEDGQKDDRNVSSATETILIIIYSLLIIFGLLTNLLISFVVARRQKMHTARNLYIVNLTVSDISLCLICMPFTLIMILRRQWTLGSCLCKLVSVLQGTNIMVSVGTITVIALDRYLTICKPTTQHDSDKKRIITSIIVIWVLSLLSTTPLFFYQVVEPVSLYNFTLYEACIEKWPSKGIRIFYGTCVLLVMAVIPPTVVGIVHARIHTYLNSHAKTQKDAKRAKKELERNKRTTTLLSGIVIVFAISWLPLGLFSLLADLVFSPEDLGYQSSPQSLYIALAIVHTIAMTSSITNPIVYGWFNSNIRHEFLQLLPKGCVPDCLLSKKGSSTTGLDETTKTQVNFHTVDNNHQQKSMTLLVFLDNKNGIDASENIPNSADL